MSQDWTDNSYQLDHIASTDLQNLEDNFVCLKSSFSGASSPSNPLAGMVWLDTTNHAFKLRNEVNNDWITLFDLLVESRASNRHLRFTLLDPRTTYLNDTHVCIIPVLDAAIVITNLEVTCNDVPTTEAFGDLKYADAFISMSNSAVINSFDTTLGVRSDNSISNGSVAAGKCIYIQFDSLPVEALTQICFDITYNYV